MLRKTVTKKGASQYLSLSFYSPKTPMLKSELKYAFLHCPEVNVSQEREFKWPRNAVRSDLVKLVLTIVHKQGWLTALHLMSWALALVQSAESLIYWCLCWDNFCHFPSGDFTISTQMRLKPAVEILPTAKRAGPTDGWRNAVAPLLE